MLPTWVSWVECSTDIRLLNKSATKEKKKKTVFMVACSDTKISPEALHLMEVSMLPAR